MQDEFAGQGGSYLLDPKTGKRKLIERTQERKPEEAPAPAASEPSQAPARKVKE